ncbi:MAG: DNA-3-methyladenine glycosylase 2 family protein [Lachnospiraceae bacterium]|nr:DNA-3-methyladenine glycosylase 2 family protein [Lachnospiraceae bacterium]
MDLRRICIEDDLDLMKIADSGQCFRVKRFEDGFFRFASKDRFIYIRNEGAGEFSVSAGEGEWEGFWRNYFDLDRCYSDICCGERNKNCFVDEAMDYGRGLRVLRQDPWEMLLTFIISQRKSIPAISGAVEMISDKYGRHIQTEREEFCLFPAAAEMADATKEDLSACALGYRVPYVLDAISRLNSGELDLEAISGLPDEELLAALQEVHGVGKKVANCIALFAYGRTGCVPVDVWISRVIEEECGGDSPFHLFGDKAGIIQQYLFYYERDRDSGQRKAGSQGRERANSNPGNKGSGQRKAGSQGREKADSNPGKKGTGRRKAGSRTGERDSAGSGKPEAKAGKGIAQSQESREPDRGKG